MQTLWFQFLRMGKSLTDLLGMISLPNVGLYMRRYIATMIFWQQKTALRFH